jgi:predicted NUDIX family NTP pyrophosphohydrolase
MKKSAGLLMFRRTSGRLEVLLAHPGGPFFRNKDDGAWTLPKGELGEGEDAEACARREFQEETGIDSKLATLLPLGEVRQKGGKRVLAWAFEAPDTAIDLAQLPPSNTFELEWPPRSGKRVSFPEVDRLAFFELALARQKLLAAQLPLLDRLAALLGAQLER